MNKLLSGVLTFFISVILVGTVYASPTVSVRLEHPKSPTNQSSINLTFVALTTTNNSITVKCFKKSPSDGEFSQFGSDIVLSAGGNTDFCPVTSSIMSSAGSYQFYITANDGEESTTSETVTVDYSNATPDTPTSYSKEHPNSCEYIIKFKTANDGTTSKVVIYRSDQTNFTADSSTEVGQVNIGPNQEGSFTNFVPDCGKNYYFVIRAFNDVGNGSGTVGDSVVTITNSSTITASPAPGTGAIPVASSQVSAGSILGIGKEGEGTEASKEGEILGEGTPSAESSGSSQPETGGDNMFSAKNLLLAAIVAAIVGAGIYYFRKNKP